MKRLFGLPFLIAGAALLYFNIAKLQDALASKSWPTTAGVVETSTTIKETSRTRNGHGAADTHDYHQARITYRYTVDGKELRSSRIEVNDRMGGQAEAMELSNRYSAGTAVTVHYDQGAPEHAVLVPGFSLGMIAFAGAGVLFTMMGCGFTIFGPGPAHAPKAAPLRP